MTQKKSHSRALKSVIAGSAIALLLLGVSATPAYANGSNWRYCYPGNTVSGSSGSSWATTSATNSGICGQVQVRDWYQYTSSSTTYWTTWRSSTGTSITVNLPAGQIGLGGQHKVSNPQPGYQTLFPFNT
jgi:hypothetical protein